MKAASVRKKFLNFFESKGHQIVPSAPMVIKDDPTLMFTNAGMNQFKDIFLGNIQCKYARVANTQKCLRVSGKHNDLEEVGHDTYHHTMFEMMGNWSFGDYFKKEAIAWAWELLTEVYGIDKSRLYVSVFTGDKEEGLPEDREAYHYWQQIVSDDRIIFGTKKDNFWEMGESGPCGPCSEIHVDLRCEADRDAVPGNILVNKGNPLVIEIWNLVFIEFNRTASGTLVNLPQKHVDTGMGFERLCMVLQNKTSNYDTDVFQPIIQEICRITKIPIGHSASTDTAIRVVADHLRAVAFAIADGQLPSNKDAGYVIRRILRRAVRYGFTFLDQKEPFIHELVPVLVSELGNVFPEIKKQQDHIMKVVAEEETAFLRTLSMGIKRFDQYMQLNPENPVIDGKFAFELFDTYGFPIDLTWLMAKEREKRVDMEGFEKNLVQQKDRSRQATQMDADDWVVLDPETRGQFIGYDLTETAVRIVRYRKVKAKGSVSFQLVLDPTPFYAESGGQVGDTGFLIHDGERIEIMDTLKEGNLILHVTDRLPNDPSATFRATVDTDKRRQTACNHSATHLLHNALRRVLGEHVEQKGSYVGPEYLRFDFSHFLKMSDSELAQTESIVNQKIRENLFLCEERQVPMEEALKMGALAFFGEKYAEQVRVIRFGESIELCGGTHVHATGQIGVFKIISEEATAAGIRRIVAVSGEKAFHYMNDHIVVVKELKQLLKNTQDVVKAVQNLLETNMGLQKKLEEIQQEKIQQLEESLILHAEKIGEISFIGAEVDLDPEGVRDLAYRLKNKVSNLFLILGASTGDKAHLTVMISEELVRKQNYHAGTLIRELAREIQGGGGGQPHFATAGGRRKEGLPAAIRKARTLL
ncbi:MAG: alanine--tRNA ligase [Bacteroidales bacterium]|nr:alanine--tRNA ligase [Lentimicrobiaceae bacterium]MDD5694483.1 alanine--tRNA ligase [Bacteroidales bacterium]